MSKAIMFLIFLGVGFNCTSVQNETIYYDIVEVKKISQMIDIKPIPPIVITSSPVYIAIENDSLYSTTFLQLKYVYDCLYTEEYSKFSLFLFDLLNKKIVIKCPNINYNLNRYTCTKIDSSVTKLYNNGGIQTLIDQYCYWDADNERYILKETIFSTNELSTLCYYFFINSYLQFDNDVDAITTFRKRG